MSLHAFITNLNNLYLFNAKEYHKMQIPIPASIQYSIKDDGVVLSPEADKSYKGVSEILILS